MATFERPMPVKTPTSAPFWDALGQHRIVIQYSPSSGPSASSKPVRGTSDPPLHHAAGPIGIALAQSGTIPIGSISPTIPVSMLHERSAMRCAMR